MTPEQQRAAIAEICGWKYDAATAEMVFVEDGQLCGVPWPSLDAMHLAEKIFDDASSDARSLWLDYLAVVVGWGHGKNQHEARFECNFRSARATADQRAEAFLRALGRWVEE